MCAARAVDELGSSLLLTNYASSRPDLLALYERGKSRQWNATTDLPWEHLVPLDVPIIEAHRLALYGTPPYERMTPGVRKRYNILESAWIISQFMHGEQASLIGCGQLMALLPDIDAKFYAASQGYDEARHTECYRRYLNEKLGLVYAIDGNLHQICDAALAASEWTFKLIAIQIIVQSLALGALKTLVTSAREPLLLRMATCIMGDESRHLAFGRLALERAMHESAPADRMRYEDFVASCVELMYDGFFPQVVFEELGLNDVPALRPLVFASEQRRMFRQDFFSVVIPSVLTVGLLTERTRPRYAALGLNVDAF